MAAAIRGYEGEASILHVQAIEDLPHTSLKEQFRQARDLEYAALIEEIKKLETSPRGVSAQLPRLRRRYDEIVAIDFFETPTRKRAEAALLKAEQPAPATPAIEKRKVSKQEYQAMVWMTRPRPGIDRVSSAWLITRMIDPKAKFLFGNDPAKHASAVPFDMFGTSGFGHEGENCTFETLCEAFGIADKKVRLIAQAIHDADLEDGKYDRPEGNIINQILQGWAKQGVADEELLRRGMDLIEGFYHSIT